MLTEELPTLEAYADPHLLSEKAHGCILPRANAAYLLTALSVDDGQQRDTGRYSGLDMFMPFPSCYVGVIPWLRLT